VVERAEEGIATERLHLRPLSIDDLDAVVALAADARVMRTLGGVSTAEEAQAWLERQLVHWRRHGYGRYVATRGGTWLGVVGLSRTDLDAGIVPGVEIAWRLAFDQWGHGYATEAARAAMHDGFERVGLDAIIAVTTTTNERSLRVMERLGMAHAPGDTFDHPRVPPGDPLRRHVVYRVQRPIGR
jgi:RimJ/RimL family protein N-acetyltransferase